MINNWLNVFFWHSNPKIRLVHKKAWNCPIYLQKLCSFACKSSEALLPLTSQNLKPSVSAAKATVFPVQYFHQPDFVHIFSGIRCLAFCLVQANGEKSSHCLKKTKHTQHKTFKQAESTSLLSSKILLLSFHINLIMKFIFVSLILHMDKNALALWITGRTRAVLS